MPSSLLPRARHVLAPGVREPAVRRRRRGTPLLLALFVVACGGGDSPSGPSRPVPVLTALTVALSATTVEAGQSVTASATGRDQNGGPIGTGAVTWSSSAPAVATVTASGAVTTLAPGQVVITASAGAVQGSASLTVTAGPPATLSAASPTALTATAGGAVAQRPSVLVRDARGFPVPNVNVAFAVTAGGGTLASAAATSDATGTATLSGWTVGTTIGVSTVTATVGTLAPLVFTATVSAGPPASLVAASAQAQAATVGRAVAQVPAVRVRDAFGNPAAGAAVSFAVTAGGGTVSGGAVVADADGLARPTSWTLGTLAGANGLSATAGTLPPVAFLATGTPDVPARLTLLRGQGQSTTVAALVPVPPAVRVADQFGNAASGVPVAFAVVGGGGAVTGNVAVSDSAGDATVGSWRLGTRAGPNTLGAAVAGVAPVLVEALGTAGPPDLYGFIAGTGQIEVVGTTLPVVPLVRVVDAFGNPVEGVPIAFGVTTGGGAVGTPSASTNADGLASPGSWRLGAAQGFNRIEASTPGFLPISIRARAVPPSNFTFDVRYVGSPPPAAVQQLVQAAVTRLRKVFVQAPSTVLVNAAANSCFTGQPALSELVAGVVIWVEIRSIDGPGGNLGAASPCRIRVPSRITTVGYTRLDLDDLALGLLDGTAYSTIVHEFLHILGFGSFWEDQALLSGRFTNDPWFNGPFARAAFNLAGGTSYTGNRVPVENVGGSGTILSHWRTSLFGGEMMQGFACRGVAPLSYITTESFFDKGIPVTQYGDDDYQVPFGDCPGGARVAGYEEPLATMRAYIEESTGAVLTEAEARRRYPEPLRLAPRTREAPPAQRLEGRRPR